MQFEVLVVSHFLLYCGQMMLVESQCHLQINHIKILIQMKQFYKTKDEDIK